MNKAILIGRLTKDIDLRMTQSGKAVGTFTIAINRYNKDGGTDFINCVAFGNTAELMKKYTDKGSHVGLSGRIQTRSYQKDDRTVYVTEVIVEDVDFLEVKKEPQDEPEPVLYDDDELPF